MKRLLADLPYPDRALFLPSALFDGRAEFCMTIGERAVAAHPAPGTPRAFDVASRGMRRGEDRVVLVGHRVKSAVAASRPRGAGARAIVAARVADREGGVVGSPGNGSLAPGAHRHAHPRG